MKIEVGKRYVRHDGEISGVIEVNPLMNSETHPFYDPVFAETYRSDGLWWCEGVGKTNIYDLISEYRETSVRDEPTTPTTEYGPWIGWNGGDCPVDDGVAFEVAMPSGTQEDATVEGWDWDSDARNPIIAYRNVIEPEAVVINGFIGFDDLFWNSEVAAGEGCRKVKITIQGDAIKAEWVE